MKKTNLQILTADKYLELILSDAGMHEDFVIMNKAYGDFIFGRN